MYCRFGWAVQVVELQMKAFAGLMKLLIIAWFKKIVPNNFMSYAKWLKVRFYQHAEV